MIQKIDISFRLIQFQDFPEIAKIESKVMPNPWSLGSLIETYDNDLTVGFVAITNNNLIGFVLGQMLDQSAELHKVAVLKKYQKSGVGRELVKNFMDSVLNKKDSSILLEVNSNNQNAIKLYNFAGFKLLNKRKGYYGRNQDALIMQYKS